MMKQAMVRSAIVLCGSMALVVSCVATISPGVIACVDDDACNDGYICSVTNQCIPDGECNSTDDCASGEVCAGDGVCAEGDAVNDAGIMVTVDAGQTRVKVDNRRQKAK